MAAMNTKALTSTKRRGRDFIARHGETVFNAAGRLQGDHAHTPLTRAGFAQAEEMAAAIPNSHLVVVPESGHASTLEQPEAVTKALVEWLV